MASIGCPVTGGKPVVFKGVVVHALKYGEVEVLDPGMVCVNSKGRIEWVSGDLGKSVGDDVEVVDLGKKMIMPGFIDTHFHAPQYPNAGTGMGLPLLKWLEKYTFPTEKTFKDAKIAKETYEQCVAQTLRNGSTTVSYFATIHLEATKILAQVCAKLGQRAYVGKVNMDRNSPDDYVETTEDSIRDTEAFIKYCAEELKSPLVTCVITPRFVPTCSAKLLQALGDLHVKHSLPLQSHLSENEGEVAWVKELHPECSSYTNTYEHYNCLSERAYMAHCVLCTGPERTILKDKRVGISHCANSNFTLGSGVAPIVDYIEQGLKVGLGTDVSGGYSPSMLNAIQGGAYASQTYRFVTAGKGGGDKDYLNFRQLFYLATMGGAEVLCLDKEVGNFVPGKQFDALVVDPDCQPLERFASNSTLDMFEKFLFRGDDRNVKAVFVAGKKVVG